MNPSLNTGEMKAQLITELRMALQQCAVEEVRKSASRFFKKGEEALTYGVKSAEVHTIAKDFYKRINVYPKKDILAICEELWKSGYLEEAQVACTFTKSITKKFEPTDFKILERWVTKYVNNWADCDTLCNHTVGTFVMMYPEYLKELKRWARTSHRWTKRAAAVSLIIPARKGLFLKDILEIAEILIEDRDDMVQKGYGWMLKTASESHQKEVFDYLMSKRELMPRTAFRYAIEKMPEDLRAAAMHKY